MKNTQFIFYSILMACFFFASCRKRNEVPAREGFLKQNFKAIEVQEGNVVVYREGATNNIIPGYAQFRLELSVNNTGGKMPV